nr:MAG TPA: hypothetical protein [Caudoviricetes sp.]
MLLPCGICFYDYQIIIYYILIYYILFIKILS